MSKRRLDVQKLGQALSTHEGARGLLEAVRAHRWGDGLPPLESMKRAHEAGYPFAAIDALNWCHEKKHAIPDWVIEALNSHYREHADGEAKRHKRGRPIALETRDDDLWVFCVFSAMRNRRLSVKAAQHEVAKLFELPQRTVRGMISRARKPRYQSPFLSRTH
jgi:hypothetical protein